VLIAGCSGGAGDARNGRERLIPAVEAVQAQYGALPLAERLSGVVRAKNQVDIYPEISAVVEAVSVQDGDEVKRGRPLASLRDREYQERLKQARASLQIAQAQARQAEARQKEADSEVKRARSLSSKGLTNDADLETAETKALSAEADVALALARVEQAAATVAEREENLTQTVLRAPVAGVVGNRDAEVGMIVGPGDRLFTVGQLDSVEVEIVLTDLMLNYIEPGQTIEISASNLPSGSMKGTLSRISPFLHPVAHSTEAEIDLANPDRLLKSGMFVTVDVYYGESEQATLVPLSALYENPLSGETGVYVGRDSANKIPDESPETKDAGVLTEPVPFEFVPVEVIAKGRMSAGVRGLEPGAWVVTIGQDLFGGEPGQAKVRPVDWTWVEHLQNLQREDLMEEVMQIQQTTGRESSGPGL